MRVSVPFTVLVLSLSMGVSSGCEEEVEEEGPFTLTVSGAGFGPHDGQTISAAVVDDMTDEVLATDSAAVTDGTFSFTFTEVISDAGTYRVDYYADFNDNGVCDAPPDDHVWSVPVSDTMGGDVTVEVDHTTDFTPEACESFPSM